ncbi:MAG: glycosyltransferase family 4 protein, partial [Anaerolineales bacterium]
MPLSLFMDILFLLTQDLESPSGLGRYWPLARELAALGHTVNITALHANFAALTNRQIQRDGVTVNYVAQMHVQKTGSEKNYYSAPRLLAVSAQATLALTRAAWQSQADIIHVCKPHPMNSVAGLLGRWRSRQPLFLDCDDLEAGSHFTGGWQKRGVVYFEEHMPLWADHLTTHNQTLENYLLGLGVPEQKITYLPNGVDYQRFQEPPEEQVAALRVQLGLNGRQVVTFIGTLSLVSHPVDLLLQAFARLYQENQNVRLLVVGGGESLPELQALAARLHIEGAVIFTGRVAPEQIPLYYRLSDVIVDPVLDNPVARTRLPLKLFESWVSRVPFVCGDAGDRRRVLGDPPAGLLVPPGDPEALADALWRVLTDAQLANQLVGLGVARAQNYDWHRLAQNLVQTYEASLTF